MPKQSKTYLYTQKLSVIILLALLGASCAKGISNNHKYLILEKKSSGGLCFNGGCFSEVVVYSDGSYEMKNNTISNKTGSVSVDLANSLITQIQNADFAALTATPFTSTCPTAYDGAKNEYAFFSSSGKNHVLDSCKVQIDTNTPLFKAVADIEKQLQ